MTTANYNDWLGRQQTQHDSINAKRIQLLAGTLDVNFNSEKNVSLPPLWHWILFNEGHKASELGHDGHAQKGGFLPPIELPRRMWAGGRFEFIEPLIIGDSLSRTSTIKKVSMKSGKSGDLAFVTVEHNIRGQQGGHWLEEHDIVYRQAPDTPWQAPETPEIETSDYDWKQVITPTPTLLFRYSALTFNGHRIHYDREYCQQQEGYPGLVFHGPLTATLLLELLRKELPNAKVKRFYFRALRPLFDHLSLTVYGKKERQQVKLWACDHYQQRAMEAVAEIMD